jgi:hypothetical protein
MADKPDPKAAQLERLKAEANRWASPTDEGLNDKSTLLKSIVESRQKIVQLQMDIYDIQATGGARPEELSKTQILVHEAKINLAEAEIKLLEKPGSTASTPTPPRGKGRSRAAGRVTRARTTER